jgi:predicted negative regulator of RcsB-dependent stress response
MEAIKRWLRQNGPSVLIGVLLAVVVVLGWNTWQQRQHGNLEAASAQYQSLLEAVRQLDEQPTPELLTTARHLADTLRKDYEDTTYAQFAALLRVRLAVQDKDLATAESELRWVLEQRPHAGLAELVRYRLARVLRAKGDDDAALKLIDEGAAGGYAHAFEKLRGDILLARGDAPAARAAYEKAQQLQGKLEQPVSDPLLEIKLQDLQAVAKES